MTARSRTRIRSRRGWIIPASGRSIRGRVTYLSATYDEALAAFQLLSRLEGIIPALEPAHAIAKVMELAPKRPRDHLMVVNLSGRGDKDVPQVGDILKGRKK
jgi:tryptophan synthase beta chain